MKSQLRANQSRRILQRRLPRPAIPPVWGWAAVRSFLLYDLHLPQGSHPAPRHRSGAQSQHVNINISVWSLIRIFNCNKDKTIGESFIHFVSAKVCPSKPVVLPIDEAGSHWLIREGFIIFSSERFWTSPEWLIPPLFGTFWTQVSFSEIIRSKKSL